jgi:hypothetical protein
MERSAGTSAKNSDGCAKTEVRRCTRTAPRLQPFSRHRRRKSFWGFTPKITAGDPQIFITGLVELIENYPDWLIARIASPVNGLPAKFKFCPLIAEIKEACEEWMVEKGREEDLKRRFSTPKLANYRPRENRKCFGGSLCARFGIPQFRRLGCDHGHAAAHSTADFPARG